AEFTDWVLTEGWGQHWGIFATAPIELDALRRHFRRFLMVRDEHGKSLYFRYFDPRVLRVYLPTCNADELTIIFGPVVRYYAEGEDPSILLEYGRVDDELRQRTVILAERGVDRRIEPPRTVERAR